MNKSLLIGVVAGIGVATAGGVAGFSMLGKKEPGELEVALVDREAAAIAPAPVLEEPRPEARPALATQSAAAAPVAAPAPAPRPAVQRAAPRPAAYSLWQNHRAHHRCSRLVRIAVRPGRSVRPPHDNTRARHVATVWRQR